MLLWLRECCLLPLIKITTPVRFLSPRRRARGCCGRWVLTAGWSASSGWCATGECMTVDAACRLLVSVTSFIFSGIVSPTAWMIGFSSGCFTPAGRGCARGVDVGAGATAAGGGGASGGRGGGGGGGGGDWRCGGGGGGRGEGGGNGCAQGRIRPTLRSKQACAPRQRWRRSAPGALSRRRLEFIHYFRRSDDLLLPLR